MKKLSNDDAFRMISLLKGNFRSVRHKTKKLENDITLSYEDKYTKLKDIEKQCVQDMMKYPDIDKDFIIELHNLLIVNTNNLFYREVNCKNLLYKYVNGNIEELFHFMNNSLFGEYERAINSPELRINLHINNLE